MLPGAVAFFPQPERGGGFEPEHRGDLLLTEIFRRARNETPADAVDILADRHAVFALEKPHQIEPVEACQLFQLGHGGVPAVMTGNVIFDPGGDLFRIRADLPRLMGGKIVDLFGEDPGDAQINLLTSRGRTGFQQRAVPAFVQQTQQMAGMFPVQHAVGVLGMPVEAEHAEQTFFMEMDPDMPEVSFYRPVIALMRDPAVDEKRIAGRGGIDPAIQQDPVAPSAG